MRKIAVGDIGEFWYGDYKEPFVQLEGAVPGYPQGVVLKADDGKLLCAYCGKTYEALGRHVQTHGMTARSYKVEVGLLQKSSLVSERVRIGEVARGMVRARRPQFIAARRLFRKGLVGPNDPRIRQGLRTPERLNRTGRCYAQLLAVANTVVRERGRLTHAGLAVHGIRRGVWQPYFPTIEALAKAAGGASGMTYWTDSGLIEALRSLAHTMGRTPSESDLRRFGYPTATTYRRRFGSYPAACERAGLISNLPIPLDSQREVAILTAYATTGTLSGTAAAVHAGTVLVSRVLARYGVGLSATAPHAWRRGQQEYAGEVARRLSGWPEIAA